MQVLEATTFVLLPLVIAIPLEALELFAISTKVLLEQVQSLVLFIL